MSVKSMCLNSGARDLNVSCIYVNKYQHVVALCAVVHKGNTRNAIFGNVLCLLCRLYFSYLYLLFDVCKG